jgi:DNA-binding protein HU-beta
MNKEELVERISGELPQFRKKNIEEVLNATIAQIMEAVATGERVALVGFGTFEPRKRQARVGRNPKTGEEIQIPATTVAAFSAGKAFKEKVSVGGIG